MTDPIRQALVDAFAGKRAHVAPVVALEALTAAQARKRPHRTLATIWEHVGHMVFWQDVMLARMRGETPPQPKTAAEGWPAMPPARAATDADWADLLAHFANGLKAADQMSRRKELSASMSAKVKRTFIDQLISLATHNSYHTGQIVTVRRMMGLWPPPSGGNTW